MSSNKSDLFVILLKLKSYLVSMLDNPESAPDTLYFTEEFLEKRFPEIKDEVINLLKKGNVNSDREIAFNNTIHHKFNELSGSFTDNLKIDQILKKYEIESAELEKMYDYFDKYRLARDKKLKDLVETLLRLARGWANLKNIQDEVDDYSKLNEEELIRPEEQKTYSQLDEFSANELTIITEDTKHYLKIISNYLFEFGGDIQLKELAEFMESLLLEVNNKYDKIIKRIKKDTGG